ncbi:MAG: TonB family protein [Candidatus Acidiferrum sp.]
MSKENEVLIAAPETTAAVPVATGARPEDTATGSRPQPVALEVPVTVNGARTVEGSDKREPFSETTKTVLVFGSGAVIRLGSPVTPGQLLFLTNEKTKKEVVCQVVKSKNYKSVSGYVELEFTESVVGFWGMRFPSDRIAAQAPSGAFPPAAKSNPVAPVSVAPKVVSPAISAAPKIPDIKPTQLPTAQIHAAVRPDQQARLAEVNTVVPAVPKPEAPVAQAPSISPSLASSLASLLNAPDAPPVVTASKPPAPPIPSEGKQSPAIVAGENSSGDLKLQAARLQEQLSSMLFSAAPTANPVPSAPVVPALNAKTVSDVAAKVFEVAKLEPAPVKAAPPARTALPPLKSSLDTEEVRIPSWLEPLARNAAAPATSQEVVEREKAKHTAEIAAREEHSAEPVAVADVESTPAVELPGIGSLLPFDESATLHDRPSGGSGRGVLFGAIAAGVLLAVGGAWYFLQPTNAVQRTSAPVTPATNTQTTAALPVPAVTQPATPPAPQTAVSTPQAAANSNAAPISSTPASSSRVTKPPATQEPVPVTRDNTRGAATTIPAAATERISRPVQEPEPKKPVLGEVHLASPTMNRPAAAQDDAADAPTISAGNPNANAESLSSGLVAGNGKQPAAPEAPLPVGGDVKSAKLINSVAPLYPAIAKNQHVSGDVRIDALIDANGRVTTMKVISGPTLLHQAAMDALRQWKYQSASLDGKPVAMHLTVTLQFRLQ